MSEEREATIVVHQGGSVVLPMNADGGEVVYSNRAHMRVTGTKPSFTVREVQKTLTREVVSFFCWPLNTSTSPYARPPAQGKLSARLVVVSQIAGTA